VSPRNNHSSLACHIAELRGGRFVIVHSEPQAVPADPYMTATDLTEFRQLSAPTPRLRIVK
jgi:branched-chain amino acid transport system substrate-binding protein